MPNNSGRFKVMELVERDFPDALDYLATVMDGPSCIEVSKLVPEEFMAFRTYGILISDESGNWRVNPSYQRCLGVYLEKKMSEGWFDSDRFVLGDDSGSPDASHSRGAEIGDFADEDDVFLFV